MINDGSGITMAINFTDIDGLTGSITTITSGTGVKYDNEVSTGSISHNGSSLNFSGSFSDRYSGIHSVAWTYFINYGGSDI